MDEHEFIPPALSAKPRMPKPVPRLGPGWGALAVPIAIAVVVLLFPLWVWTF